MEVLNPLLNFFAEHGVLFFPYFAAIALILIVYLSRSTSFFSQHGLQLVTLAMLIPSLLFATGKQWISHDSLTAIFSGIVGYVFGSGARSASSNSN
jgi:hypothetical protein